MRIRVLALLLVVSMWPSAAESAELAVHWVKYGDVADAPGDRHGPQPFGGDDEHGCSEHGCTPMFHVCGCHNGAIDRVPRLIAHVPSTTPLRVRAVDPGLREGRVDGPPDLRPPIV